MGFYPDDTPVSAAEPVIELAPGVPFGFSFIGTAWSEYELIGMAYAFEQSTRVRATGRKAYDAAIPKTQLQDVMLGYMQ